MFNTATLYILYKITGALAWLGGPRWLQSFVILSMIFIPVFGARLVSIGGLVSNVGNIFYAFVLFGLAALIYQHGRRLAYETLVRIFGVFAFLFVVSDSLVRLPVVEGNEGVAAAQATLYGFEGSIIVASFVALAVAVTFFIWMVDKFQNTSVWSAYLFPVLLTQVIDSVIFFPIAFGGIYDTSTILEFMKNGLIIKASLAILTTPLVAWLLHRHRHPTTLI